MTHAFASDDLDVDSGFDWILDRGPKLRVEAQSDKALFIGVARSADVERYLAGVEYDSVTHVDVDPFSARGIVQDYKSGTAHSARRIDQDGRLQIPLYILALRDLVGIEPLGGLYRSLSGEREARGLLRAEARDDVPGFPPLDYLSEDDFWGVVARAQERARRAVARIREGDVRHDPRGEACPAWCDRWPICRVARA